MPSWSVCDFALLKAAFNPQYLHAWEQILLMALPQMGSTFCLLPLCKPSLFWYPEFPSGMNSLTWEHLYSLYSSLWPVVGSSSTLFLYKSTLLKHCGSPSHFLMYVLIILCSFSTWWCEPHRSSQATDGGAIQIVQSNVSLTLNPEVFCPLPCLARHAFRSVCRRLIPSLSSIEPLFHYLLKTILSMTRCS